MKTVLSAASFAAVFATSVHASVLSYTDRASFDAATGPQTKISSPSLGVSTSGLSFGGLSITSAPGFANTFQTDYNATSLMTNELALSFESFDITFAAPVFGFGMNIVEPSVGGDNFGTCDVPVCTDSTFDISVLSGGTQLAAFTVSPDDDVLSFFGVAGNMAFNKIEVREQGGQNDDELFGDFVTAAAPAAVPLPATGMLLLAGLAAMRVARRRS